MLPFIPFNLKSFQESALNIRFERMDACDCVWLCMSGCHCHQRQRWRCVCVCIVQCMYSINEMKKVFAIVCVCHVPLDFKCHRHAFNSFIRLNTWHAMHTEYLMLESLHCSLQCFLTSDKFHEYRHRLNTISCTHIHVLYYKISA